MSELVRLEGALFGYGRRPLFPPLTLGVEVGARLAVLGPNGGGKSTLLKVLAGLHPLQKGHRSHPLGRPARLGYVPQAHRADPLFPFTAREVVSHGRLGARRLLSPLSRADVQASALALARVGLAEVAGQEFRALSGGQRQRVLLARALCAEPELLVLDEFTSDLDPAAASALLREVHALAREARVGVVFVTHQIQDAVTHASTVLLVDARRGLCEHGSADVVLTSPRLSDLYGQAVRVEREGGRAVAFLENTRGEGVKR